MFRYITLFLFAFFLSPQSYAQCYSKAQAEAEQGIRIHSELMVIGLNCQHMGQRIGEDFYGAYRQFTHDHADLFRHYENTLLSFYKEYGTSNPEKKLNTLRTGFANKISEDAASMRPDLFCAQYTPRIQQASKMDTKKVRQWASTFFPSHPVSVPICTGG